MKKCLCGCGRVASVDNYRKVKKDYFNFECYLRAMRKKQGGTRSYQMKRADNEEDQIVKDLLEWAKIGHRESMKILRDVHGLMTFFDGGAIICMENARL